MKEGSRKYQQQLPKYEKYEKELKNQKNLFIKGKNKYIKQCQKYPDFTEYHDEGVEFLKNKFPNITYTNHFIITCRIAASDYIFTNFTEVEIADFDEEQIKTFSKNWFEHKDPIKSSKFMQKLYLNPRVKELANNPLLLTLLCLVFEDKTDFPSNRSRLYEDGISILLTKWDGQRSIEREKIYQNLDTTRKEDLLSQIAMSTFEQGNYFFEQKDVQKDIVNYIKNLPEFIKNPEQLKPDSGLLVLKSIEAQHGLLVERANGIYSFSHLTFHEYFTAYKIVDTSEPKKLEEGLKRLASHITENRWLEVFLLSLEKLKNASYLMILIKEEIDSIVVHDKKLQQILEQIKLSSEKIQCPYKPPALRAFLLARILVLQKNVNFCSDFASNLNSALNQASQITKNLTKQKINKPFAVYFSYVENIVKQFKDLFVSTFNSYEALDLRIAPAFALDSRFTSTIKQQHQIDINSELDKVLYKARAIAQTNKREFNPIWFSALALSLYFAFYKMMNLSENLAPELIYDLQELEKQLPKPESQKLNKWLQLDSQKWINGFRTIVNRYHDFYQDWQLDEVQTELIQKYQNANLLLVEFLSKDEFYIDLEVRENIEDTMLLPKQEINPVTES